MVDRAIVGPVRPGRQIVRVRCERVLGAAADGMEVVPRRVAVIEGIHRVSVDDIFRSRELVDETVPVGLVTTAAHERLQLVALRRREHVDEQVLRPRCVVDVLPIQRQAPERLAVAGIRVKVEATAEVWWQTVEVGQSIVVVRIPVRTGSEPEFAQRLAAGIAIDLKSHAPRPGGVDEHYTCPGLVVLSDRLLVEHVDAELVPDVGQTVTRLNQRLADEHLRHIVRPANLPGDRDGGGALPRTRVRGQPRDWISHGRLASGGGEVEACLHGIPVVHADINGAAPPIIGAGTRPPNALAVAPGMIGVAAGAGGLTHPRVGEVVQGMRSRKDQAGYRRITEARITPVGANDAVHLHCRPVGVVRVLVLHEHMRVGAQIIPECVRDIAALSLCNERVFVIGVVAGLGRVVLGIDDRRRIAEQHIPLEARRSRESPEGSFGDRRRTADGILRHGAGAILERVRRNQPVHALFQGRVHAVRKLVGRPGHVPDSNVVDVPVPGLAVARAADAAGIAGDVGGDIHHCLRSNRQAVEIECGGGSREHGGHVGPPLRHRTVSDLTHGGHRAGHV